MALSVSASASFQQTTLDNGLRVILREVRERPLVGAWMWYRVGGRNELPGTTGVSHWVEHMLFKGGKRFGKGEITKEVSRRGGALNAFTWIDCTAYYLTLPSAEIDLALAIESDRIYDTRIEPEEAEAERTVVISEREGSENYPEFWLREEVQAAAWREHPYRLGVIGPKSDLRAMTREDLYAHYKRYYMTNNASLVIVGDFDTPQLLDKIHAEFDKHPAGPRPPPCRSKSSRKPASGASPCIARARPTTSCWRTTPRKPATPTPRRWSSSARSWAAPPVRSPGAARAGWVAARDCIGRMIDGEIATSVSASYELTLDPYLFAIDATLREGVEPARAEAALVRRSRAHPARGRADTTSLRARNASCMRRSSTRSRASPIRALRWASWTWSRATRRPGRRFPEALQSVTADDVQRVARPIWSNASAPPAGSCPTTRPTDG